MTNSPIPDPLHERNSHQAPADDTPLQVLSGKTSTLFWALAVFVAGVALFAVIQVDSWGERSDRLSPRFELDTSELTKVDAAQIMFSEIATFPIDMNTPRAIAANQQGDVAVAGDTQVLIFDKSGTLVHQIELEAPPTCVAFASGSVEEPDATHAESIYVGFRASAECYDKSGNRLNIFSEGFDEDSLITSIAAFEENVFVADAGKRAVFIFNRAGELLTTIDEAKKTAQGLRGFVVPSAHFDVAAADDGVLRVVNPGARLIEAFTLDGDSLGSWGEGSSTIEGFFGCCNPAALGVLPDGRFVTAEKGIPRVKIYNSDGEFESVVAPPSAFSNNSSAKLEIRDSHRVEVLDVAVDGAGRILVLDPNRQNIRIFTENPIDE